MFAMFGAPTAMTQMSDRRVGTSATTSANYLPRHGGSPVARPLHASMMLGTLVLSLLMVGCILPPSLSVDVQDAGVDSPPAITDVRSDQQDLPEPGPVLFQVGADSTLNLTLLDTDLTDTLYVRIFVDYTDAAPTAPRSSCTGVSSTTSAVRTATCDLKALCLPADVGQTRLMRIVVFDRQVLDSGPGPAFMTMAPGGESTGRTYQLECTS